MSICTRLLQSFQYTIIRYNQYTTVVFLFIHSGSNLLASIFLLIQGPDLVPRRDLELVRGQQSTRAAWLGRYPVCLVAHLLAGFFPTAGCQLLWWWRWPWTRCTATGRSGSGCRSAGTLAQHQAWWSSNTSSAYTPTSPLAFDAIDSKCLLGLTTLWGCSSFYVNLNRLVWSCCSRYRHHSVILTGDSCRRGETARLGCVSRPNPWGCG